jgi:hypothetical protein
MNNGSLDVKNLLVVGFDFLQQYFLSVNEASQKLLKSQAPKKSQGTSYGTAYGPYTLNIYGGYGPVSKPSQNKTVDAKLPTFKVTSPPQTLDKLEIVWNIALKCQNPAVVPKAIEFLIKVYYNLDTDLDSQRITI